MKVQNLDERIIRLSSGLVTKGVIYVKEEYLLLKSFMRRKSSDWGGGRQVCKLPGRRVDTKRNHDDNKCRGMSHSPDIICRSVYMKTKERGYLSLMSLLVLTSRKSCDKEGKDNLGKRFLFLILLYINKFLFIQVI